MSSDHPHPPPPARDLAPIVYDELRRGNSEYKTVVLDSLTEIQKFSMGQIMNEVVTASPDRDPDIPSVREWGKNIEQVRRLVRAFRDLPMNVIFTALANSEKDAKTGVVKTKPALSGKLANGVAGFMDIVVYLYKKAINKDGEDVVVRAMLTTSTDQYVCKDRSNRLPMVMEDPTMPKAHAEIHGANKQLQGAKT